MSEAPPVGNFAFYGMRQSPLGTLKTQILEFSPAKLGQRQAYTFYMADGRSGENLQGTLRFWVYHVQLEDDLAVDINGQPVESGKIERFSAGEFRTGLPGVRYEISLADCPEFRGNNELGLRLKTTDAMDEIPYMEELDIFV